MRTDVTQQQIDSYRENGFLILDEFLDAAELEHWRESVTDAVRSRSERSPGGGVASLEGYRGPAEMFTQRLNLFQTDERVRKLVLDAEIGEMACTLADVDGVRIWQDQALVKEPYSPPTLFHLDVPYWSFSSPDAISIWVALDDATLSNGALCYIPGSHKVHRYDNAPGNGTLGGLFECYPEWQGVDPVFCPVKAGGAVLHNGLTAHAAGANMTPRPRRAMTIAFMPDGATFNGQQNVLPDEVFGSYTIGDPLVDEVTNPLVFSRSKAGVS